MSDCCARGRHHIAVDGDDAAGRCRINQHGRLAADRVHMRVDDSFDECCSDGSIDSIAATGEHSRACRSGKIVLGRDHRAAAHYKRVDCRHLSSFFLRSVFITRSLRMRIFAICFRDNILHITTRIWQKGACIRAFLRYAIRYIENQATLVQIPSKKENRGFVRFPQLWIKKQECSPDV